MSDGTEKKTGSVWLYWKNCQEWGIHRWRGTETDLRIKRSLEQNDIYCEIFYFELTGFFDGALKSIEYEAIMSALNATNFHQKNAADLLGITARALNYRIEKLGITHERWKKNNPNV